MSKRNPIRPVSRSSRAMVRRLDGGRSLFLVAAVVALALVAVFAVATMDRGDGGREAAGSAEETPAWESQVLELQAAATKAQAGLLEKPDDAALLVKLGNARYDIGVTYMFHLGNAERARDEFRLAVDAYRKALEQDPENVDVRVDMATAAFYGGMHELAEGAFRKSIEIKPDHINAHLNYGVFLSQARNDPAAAIDQWNRVLELTKDPAVKERVQGMIREAKARIK